MKVNEKIENLMEIGFKTATGFLPAPISNFINALYDDVKTNNLNKRAEKWKAEVFDRLSKLEAEYDDITNSDSFANALIRTTELAIKTNSESKRKMLANALINSYKQNIDEDRIAIFLNLIEKYTTLHIEILRYIHDDYMKTKYNFGPTPSFWSVFWMKFNKIEETYLKKAIKDLQNDYLMDEFNMDAPIETFNYRIKLITKLGEDFYYYLKE